MKLISLQDTPPAATLRKLDVDPFRQLHWEETHVEILPCKCGHDQDQHGAQWVPAEQTAPSYSKRRQPKQAGHWTEKGCTECECTTDRTDMPRDVQTAKRAGQFWADGSMPRKVWVMPFEPAPWENGQARPVELDGSQLLKGQADIESIIMRADTEPATDAPSPTKPSIAAEAPSEQAEHDDTEDEMGETMDTEQAPAPAPEADRFEDPDAWRDKSAKRRAAITKTAQEAGIRPATGTVAVRQAATVAATGNAPQIDGAALLGYVRGFIGRFTYLSPAQADAVALWIGHTHARDEEGYLSWAASPRLYALSSKPGSGKSTLLEHCGRLCPATFGLDTEPTEAGLVYTISKEHATVLLDEGDVLFASGRRKAAVRAVINSGYTPNGTTLKIKGGKGERVRIYGALALAALDVVEKATGGTMEATMTRGVPVRMIQAPEGHEIPEMTRTDEMNAAKLKMVLEKWGTGNRDEMASLPVEVPDGIRNRQAQIWKTLLRVGLMADITHQRVTRDPEAVPPGGSWYERAYAACQALALAGADDDAERTADMMDELAADLGGWDTGGEL